MDKITKVKSIKSNNPNSKKVDSLTDQEKVSITEMFFKNMEVSEMSEQIQKSPKTILDFISKTDMQPPDSFKTDPVDDDILDLASIVSEVVSSEISSTPIVKDAQKEKLKTLEKQLAEITAERDALAAQAIKVPGPPKPPGFKDAIIHKTSEQGKDGVAIMTRTASELIDLAREENRLLEQTNKKKSRNILWNIREQKLK